MKYLVVIPARYESSRFPGKPLAKINGKEMILRVCEQVEKSGLPFLVATDDKRIHECVVRNGFSAVMTSTEHNSGTDRICEAVRNSDADPEVVINVQGDEPFIDPTQILQLAEIFERHPDTKIATLIKEYDASSGFEGLEDPNKVKVVVSDKMEALYFSRSVIPYRRGVAQAEWAEKGKYYIHKGIYAYTWPVLQEVTRLPQGALEKAESLEQLRWLENGYKIAVDVTFVDGIGIDTEADLKRAEQLISAREQQ